MSLVCARSGIAKLKLSVVKSTFAFARERPSPSTTCIRSVAPLRDFDDQGCVGLRMTRLGFHVHRRMTLGGDCEHAVPTRVPIEECESMLIAHHARTPVSDRRDARSNDRRSARFVDHLDPKGHVVGDRNLQRDRAHFAGFQRGDLGVVRSRGRVILAGNVEGSGDVQVDIRRNFDLDTSCFVGDRVSNALPRERFAS